MLVALAVAVVGVTYWRLWYGIDLTDEAFYVAIPYRFVRGAHPFVDEVTVTQQTTGILLYPFVRAYYAVAGLTGIFLFVRHLQLVLSTLVALAVYLSTRRPFGATPAAAAALTVVVFVPFGIRGLSYNSVACSLFTAGCFLGFRSLAVTGARRSRLAAGLCHGLAAFAYPPLVGAVAVTLGVRLAVRRTSRRRELAEYGLAAVGLPALGMGVLAVTAGVSQLASDYRNSSRYLGQAGGFHKLTGVVSHEWSTLRHWYLIVGLLALYALLRRRHGVLACGVLLLLPFAFLPTHPLFFGASLEFVGGYGWLALPLLLALRRNDSARRLAAAVWLPALAAGATTAYSSANGGINFGVGFFPATIVASLLLALGCSDAWARRPTQRFSSFPAAAFPALAALAILGISSTIPVYHDSGLTRLGAMIDSGPYAGLVTSPGKRAYVEQLQADLAPYGPRCTIVFLNDFPAGYLFTRAQPDTPLAWISNVSATNTRSYQDALLDYYRRHELPSVVVLERWIPFSLVRPRTGRSEYYHWSAPFLATIRRDYRLVLWRRAYAIYARADAPCGGS